MSIAHTSAFFPLSAAILQEAIQDQGLTEDLGVRPGPEPGQVILYALEGASSWPYECTIGDDQVDFDIADFLAAVARDEQEIEAYENGEVVSITIGVAVDPTPPVSIPG